MGGGGATANGGLSNNGMVWGDQFWLPNVEPLLAAEFGLGGL